MKRHDNLSCFETVHALVLKNINTKESIYDTKLQSTIKTKSTKGLTKRPLLDDIPQILL